MRKHYQYILHRVGQGKETMGKERTIANVAR